MAQTELRFSASKMRGTAFVTILFGAVSVWLGYALSDYDLIRHGHILSLIGATGARWFLILAGVGIVLSGLAWLRRVIGRRPAAAIRHDGIELTGVFLSRHIPWRSLERLYLREWRFRGKSLYYVKADSRPTRDGNALHHYLAGLSYGVSTRLIAASDEEAARWVAAANAARPGLPPPHPPALAPRAAPQTRIGFGRRVL